MNLAARVADARKLIDACHGAGPAVRTIVCLGRALWEIKSRPHLRDRAYTSPLPAAGSPLVEGVLRDQIHKEFRRADDEFAQKHCNELVDAVLAMFVTRGYARSVEERDAPGQRLMEATADLYHPSTVCDALLSPYLGRAQVAYLLRQEKRDRFKLALSPPVVRAFNLFAKILNDHIAARTDLEFHGAYAADFAGTDVIAEEARVSAAESYVLSRNNLFNELRAALRQDFEHENWSRWLTTGTSGAEYNYLISNVVTAFIECCLMVRYLAVSSEQMDGGAFDLHTDFVDAEYLISHLFGMPTSITGLDFLFGGGGLLLAEDVACAQYEQPRGRVILIRGRAGLGKSILSLQFALELAKRGGVAWVCPFEQSATESLQSLESTFHRDLTGVEVLVGVSGGTKLADVRKRKHGALVLVPTIKSSVSDFLAGLELTCKRLAGFPLKLLVVDPINSVRHSDKDEQSLRSEFVAAFEKVKALRVNVLLVGEEDERAGGDNLDFLEKICDVSIRLTLESNVFYSPKYLEIRKSRLQREHRGKHPYSIAAGKGYIIQPSTVAVGAWIRSRRKRWIPKKTRFGLPELDRRLGEAALMQGDVVVIQGTAGSWRRELAVTFLLGHEQRLADEPPDFRAVPLLVAFGQRPATLQALLEEDHIAQLTLQQELRNPSETQILSFTPGYVSPGHIFQRLRAKIEEMRLARMTPDRIMVDGITLLDGMFPLLVSDKAFAATLVEFFRRHRSSVVYVIGEVRENEPFSASSVICENADVLINLTRSGVDSAHVEGQIIKAHGTQYVRSRFELSVGQEGANSRSG